MPMPAIDLRWWTHFKTIGAVRVAHVNVRPQPEAEAAAYGWLDKRERDRFRRFEFDGPRRRFALCRSALRAILCDQLGCENEDLAFASSPFGKPIGLERGAPAAVSFNVSHSGDHGLVAYAPTGRLGVDVEERDGRRNLDMLINTVFTCDEKAAIRSRQGPRRVHLFYRLWTLKEALMKAQGEGIHLDAASIRLPVSMLRGTQQGSMELSRLPGVSWHVQDLGNEEFAAAVAFEID